jgi:putative thiamine transport system permease protein
MLRTLYIALIVVCIVPTIPGVIGMISSAFGYIPALGLNHLSIFGFEAVFAWDGVWHSIGLSLSTAILSSYIACLLTFAIVQRCWNTRFWKKVEVTLSPLLAIPHVAFAIGFAFLFAPTGISARLAFYLVGYDANAQTVSDIAWLVKDPYGLGLIAVLALKEVPFLLLMSIPILQRLNVENLEKIGHSLGYGSSQTWLKVIFPQWFAHLRFPMLAVLAYSVSVVDVAQIIGPTNPPTFSVLVWQWFNDANLSLLPRASAGAVTLFILACMLIGLARLIEWCLTAGYQKWQYSGRLSIIIPGKSLFTLIALLSAAMLPITLLWSVAQRWRFPDLLPSRFSLRFWANEWPNLASALSQSIVIAVIAAAISIVLALVAHEYRLKYKLHIPGYVMVVPMLIPQLSVLSGLQITAMHLNSELYLFWVCWAHVFFVFPYVYLSLDGPWRGFDDRLTQVALSLGKTPWQTWVRIKLPILLPAILFACAVGISVSLAQYLPTLILGAGRVSTITTEAVALSSGFDRRVTAVYALLQAILPLLFFAIALLMSKQSFRRDSTIAMQRDVSHFNSKENLNA